ncbi:ABC transporter substrate-binding protein [uncultured Paraglaciecola sp.]|uniref:substrate-binding periplasmic protein n=1 Tax=uncultured Paraglaciecola sp. TaxID=1765024 RepID=UPI002632B94D|nr:transporter substrate-binding domain-containing protein [uncultured Paraglaciecola sp.]
MHKLLTLALLLYSGIVKSNNVIDVTYFISDKSSAPIQIPSENSGIVTDVIRKLDMPNVNLVYKTLPFKRMVVTLEKSKEPWLTYGSAKWQDARAFDLSATPLMTVRHVLMTTAGTPYKSIDDILDKSLVLIRGFSYPGLIDYINKKPEKVFYVNTHKAAIEMVLKGRVTAFIEMNSRLGYHLHKLGISSESINVHDFSDIIPNYDVNLSFSDHFPKTLRSSIESQLYNLKSTGQLEAILQKYQ